MKDHIFPKIIELADATVAKFKPEKMKWDWGEALLQFSLGKLYEETKDKKYIEFVKAYCDYYYVNTPRVDKSNTIAPGLAAYTMHRETKENKYKEMTDRVLNYIKTAPGILEGLPNHLGVSPEGKLYPKSIWVDSIMMESVFVSWIAYETKDESLTDFAAKQPALFAKYLQDKDAMLFHHSYWVKSRRPYPKGIFWGRGNGWVIAALPMIIDFLPDGQSKDEALKILQDLSEAILAYQREDGFWETVMNFPGKTYIESSATALIASGWLHAVRCGYINKKFQAPALKALKAVVDSLEYKNGLLSMPLISGGTPPFQYLWYKLIPRRNDLPYGLAALFMAGINYKKLKLGK